MISDFDDADIDGYILGKKIMDAGKEEGRMEESAVRSLFGYFAGS